MKRILLLFLTFLGVSSVRAAGETYETSTADYDQMTVPTTMDLIWSFKLVASGNVTNAVIVDVKNGTGTANPSGALTVPTSVVNADTGIGYIVKKLDDGAFANQIGLTAISIPVTVQEIGTGVFVGCTVLSKITVAEDNPWFSSVNGVLYDKDRTTLIVCPATTEVLSLPSSLTSIASTACANCHRLTSVTVPASVTTIGSRAFTGCTLLESLTFKGNAPTADATICDDPADITIYKESASTGWDVTPWTSFKEIRNTTAEASSKIQHAEHGSVTWYYRIVADGAELYNNGDAVIPTGATQTYWYDSENKIWVGEGTLTLPTMLGGYPVTRIGKHAFRNCASLTTIVIPSSVSVIDDYAFEGCRGIESITLPTTLTELGVSPFTGTWIASLALPGKLASLHGNPVAGCENLDSLTVDAKNRNFIAVDNVLYNRKQTRLYGVQTFVEKMTVPASVAWIATNAFSSCTLLTSVTYEGNAPVLDDDGESLYADTDKDLTSYAAADTTGWDGSTTSTNMPAKWPLVGSNRRAIKSLYNPSGSDVDPSSTGLSETDSTGVTWYYRVVDGVAEIYREGSCAAQRDTAITALTLPATLGTYIVKGLGDCALANLRGITTLEVPSTYEWIGDSAFSNCTSLATINLNHGLRRIGAHTFAETAIETIELPDTVESIDGNPIWGCRPSVSLKLNATNPFFASSEEGALYDRDFTTLHAVPMTVETLAVPATCTNFAHEAFAGCVRLKSVTFAGNAPACADGDATFADCHADLWLTVPKGNDTFGPLPGTWHGRPVSDSTAAPSRPDGTDTTVIRGITWTYESKNGLITITEGLLEQSAEVTVPPDIDGCPVVQFGDGFQVFNGCADLVTALTIPVSVTNIGNSACSSCTALSRVTLDAATNLTTIGQNAFYNCNVLDDVVLPASVRAVGDHAFEFCSSLTSVTLPDQLQTLGSDAFSYCTSLEGINLPQTLSEIRQSTFSECFSLAEVSLPSNITSIGGSAFSGNFALKAITIPEHVGSLGYGSFTSCSSLEEVTFEGPVPNGLKNSHILDYVKNVNCPLQFEEAYRKFLPEGCTLNGASSNEDGVSTVTDDSGCAWTVTIDGADVALGAYGETPVIPNTTTGAISIPSNVGRRPVTQIPAFAFAGCGQVTKITIPASVTNIAADAFYGCTSLAEFAVAKDNPAFCSKYRCLYSKDGKTLVRVPAATRFAATQSQTTTGEKKDFVEILGLIEESTGLLQPNTIITKKSHGKSTDTLVCAFTPALAASQLFSGVTRIADCAFSDCARIIEGETVSGTLTTKENGKLTSTQTGTFALPFSTDSREPAETTNVLTSAAGFYQDKVCLYRTATFGMTTYVTDVPLVIPATVTSVSASAFDNAHFTSVSHNVPKLTGALALIRLGGTSNVYGPLTPGVNASLDMADFAGCTASGLPTGLKWTKATGVLAGIPTKPGTYEVTFKQTVKDNGRNETITQTATVRVADTPTMVLSATRVNALTGENEALAADQKLSFYVGVSQQFALSVADDLAGAQNTITAKGLPAGLKLMKTALKNEKNVITNYAYTISGAPAKVQTSKTVTLTVSNKYKWAGSLNFEIEILALPNWIAGSYNGVRYDTSSNAFGAASATLSTAGKLSGKFLVPSDDLKSGKTYTFSAASLTAYDAEADTFLGTATMKIGKTTYELPFAIVQAEDGTGRLKLETPDGQAELVQNIWNRTDLKSPAYTKGMKVTIDGITFKFAAKGVVTWSGKIEDDNGNALSVSGTSQLLNDKILVLYVASKKNLLGGICQLIDLP